MIEEPEYSPHVLLSIEQVDSSIMFYELKIKKFRQLLTALKKMKDAMVPKE